MPQMTEFIKPNSPLHDQLISSLKFGRNQEKESRSLVSWFTEWFPQKKIGGLSSGGSTHMETEILTFPFGKNTSDLEWWKDNLEYIVRRIAKDHATVYDKIYPTHNYVYHISTLKFYFEDLNKYSWFNKTPDCLVLGQGGYINRAPLVALHVPAIEYKLKGFVYILEEMGNYKNNKDIGSFATSSPWAFIMALVCHELAHVFQVLYNVCTGYTDSDHGVVFQSHYKLLRNKYVNPVLSQEYKNLIDFNYQLAKR